MGECGVILGSCEEKAGVWGSIGKCAGESMSVKEY